MFKAIFWDNDGVLVNTEPLYFKACRKALGEAGIELTEDFYMNDHLKTNRSTFDLAREQGFSAEHIQQLRANKDNIYMEMISKHVPIIDGVIDTLNELKDRFEMGMVTSSPRGYMNIIFKQTGLNDFFSFVITNDDITREKPNPEPYLLALSKTGLKPEDCLVIEDTERGIVAAKEAGLTCYAIPNELSRHNDFSKADRVLKTVRELPQLILN